VTRSSIVATLAAGLGLLALGRFPAVSAEASSTLTAESLRTLREAAGPGWRREALKRLEAHGRDQQRTNASSQTLAALAQEAVWVVGTPELFSETWTPTPGSVSAVFDLNSGRALELDPSGTLSIRDLASGVTVETRPARSVPDRQVVRFDPTSGWLASIDREGHWSFRGLGKEHREVTWDAAPASMPAWISFHPELQRIATADPAATNPGVRLSPLPPRGPEGVRRISLPSAPHRLEFSPSGTRLAALCSNQPALWVIQPSLEQVQEQVPLPDVPVDFAWMPDARRVVVAGPRAIWIVDAQEGSVWPFDAEVHDVAAIALNESGTLLAAGLTSGRIELWDFKAARRIAGLPAAGSAIHRLQWDAKATRLSVTAAGEATPRLAGVSISRDLVHFLAPSETRLPEQPDAGLRRDGHRVWVRLDPKSALEIELPTPKDLKSAAISANGAWVQLRGGDDAITEWNLPRLNERLKRFGLIR
jgi:hypothetical protein